RCGPRRRADRRGHATGARVVRARAARSGRRSRDRGTALLRDQDGPADPRGADTRRADRPPGDPLRRLAAAGAEAGLRDAVAPVPRWRGHVVAAPPGVARLREAAWLLDLRG